MKKFVLIVFFFSVFSINLYAKELNWEKLIPIIIKIESGGNPYAISKDGCIGLMQISRAVFIEYSERESDNYYTSSLNKSDFILFNPDRNIEIGTWYLKRIWHHYLPHYKMNEIKEKPLLLLLACYNWGIGNVVKWYRNGAKYNQLPKETRIYYEKFSRLYWMQK